MDRTGGAIELMGVCVYHGGVFSLQVRLQLHSADLVLQHKTIAFKLNEVFPTHSLYGVRTNPVRLHATS